VISHRAASARAWSAVRIACHAPSSCQRRYNQYTHCHGRTSAGLLGTGILTVAVNLVTNLAQPS
jgi:hypothetical protein